MAIYKVRPGAESYGHDIGILLVHCRTPFIPGDVGNASSYRYPVLYRSVPDLTLERLIEQGDISLAGQVIEKALELEAAGVKAVTSDCGYMLHFQPMVAAALSIPVMLSSLLQLSFIASIINPEQSIGVICANRRRLTSDMLKRAYSGPTAIHVVGLEDCPYFRGPMLDETPLLDSERITEEIVAAAKDLCDREPDVGAILLECSNMPPYASAIQHAVQRPVFDFMTMIDYVRASCRRQTYVGHY